MYSVTHWNTVRDKSFKNVITKILALFLLLFRLSFFSATCEWFLLVTRIEYFAVFQIKGNTCMNYNLSLYNVKSCYYWRSFNRIIFDLLTSLPIYVYGLQFFDLVYFNCNVLLMCYIQSFWNETTICPYIYVSKGY